MTSSIIAIDGVWPKVTTRQLALIWINLTVRGPEVLVA